MRCRDRFLGGDGRGGRGERYGTVEAAVGPVLCSGAPCGYQPSAVLSKPGQIEMNSAQDRQLPPPTLANPTRHRQRATLPLGVLTHSTSNHTSRDVPSPPPHPPSACISPIPALERPVLTSSNFYIEVFSRRYWQSIEAESAAKAEALLLKAERHRERQRQHGGGGSGEGGGLRTDDSFDGLLSASSGGGAGENDDDGGEGDEWADEVDDSLEEEDDEDLEESDQEEGAGEGGGGGEVAENGVQPEKCKDV